MELRELRYFLAVAEELNVTRAAERLYLSQPSLSKQIQDLEKELGKPLFVRGHRRLVLTETGLLLQKRAQEILSLYEKAEAELASPFEEASGPVLIGGGESHAVREVARVAGAVRREYPLIRFHFYSSDAADVIERLEKGLVDFGVLVDFPDLSRYESLRLPLADTWGVLMRKDCPLAEKPTVTPQDLAGVPLLCSMQSLTKGSRLLRWFGSEFSRMQIGCRYNLLYNASLFVLEGLGCAIGLDHIVNTSGESELCFRPLSPRLETHLDIVWKKNAVFSKPAQIFLDALQRAFTP